MHKIPALLAAGALAAAPFVGSAAAHAADPADTSGPEQEQKRELTFALTSQTIKDDSAYGLVEEYRFDVTNSGDEPTDGTLRAFNDKDENYIDDEGQEMWLACDWIFPGLEPGRTITCTMQVRIVDSELAAGKTDPQQVHFRGFKGQEKAFAGFTTASLPIPAESLPEDDADDDSGADEQPVTTATTRPPHRRTPRHRKTRRRMMTAPATRTPVRNPTARQTRTRSPMTRRPAPRTRRSPAMPSAPAAPCRAPAAKPPRWQPAVPHSSSSAALPLR